MRQHGSKLIDYLYTLGEKSEKGEIPWTQTNPTTFQWIQDNGSEKVFVTIQKAATPVLRRSSPNSFGSMDTKNHVYLFQISEKYSKQTTVSLSTRERPEIYEPLHTIYEGAEKGMDRRAAKVLENLLMNNL